MNSAVFGFINQNKFSYKLFGTGWRGQRRSRSGSGSQSTERNRSAYSLWRHFLSLRLVQTSTFFGKHVLVFKKKLNSFTLKVFRKERIRSLTLGYFSVCIWIAKANFSIVLSSTRKTLNWDCVVPTRMCQMIIFLRCQINLLYVVFC